MEENRTTIKIGDPNNAYIEDDGKCITYKIDSDFTEHDYDQSKYEIDEESTTVTNYTDMSMQDQ